MAVRDTRTRGRIASVRLLGIAAALSLIVGVPSRTAQPKFFDDDPLQVEPETQDASKVEEWEIDLFVDLSTNLFGKPGDRTPNVRARNINTVDEVPDSSWFTNRIGVRAVSIAEAVRGPAVGAGPASGPWTVVAPKHSGFAPGFTMRDSAGETWFVAFDADGYPDAATGAILAANKIFWALGYFQVEHHLIAVRPDALEIAPTAKRRLPSGAERPMRRSDLDDVFRRAHRGADGSYRAAAGRAIPGRVVGGFRYHGTRPDDPNDIVPHEHRRELRALKVFGAWTNLVDMKAGNTLDTVIEARGRSVVRHYLQDVGSTFGTGALGFRDYDEGWEYLYEGRPLVRRLLTLGFAVPLWARIPYDERPGVGRFEAEAFDPLAWKPRVPTAAFLRARPDDTFWAARRLAAFSDAMIRGIAGTAAFAEPAATAHLADTLIARRDRILRTYLPAVNPVVDVALADDGVLTFENAAVSAGVAEPPAGYTVTWARFDNATHATEPLTPPTAVTVTRAAAPRALPSAPGEFVKVQISASGGPPAWAVPVDAYFRRQGAGWKLVGFERLP